MRGQVLYTSFTVIANTIDDNKILRRPRLKKITNTTPEFYRYLTPAVNTN